MSKTHIIIPARLNSSRLPRKVLLDETGLPLVAHTYRACEAANVGEVTVATDSAEVFKALTPHGINVVMTGPCASGTERVWAAAQELLRGTADQRSASIINCQADEPEITAAALRRVKRRLEYGAQITTVATDWENVQFLQPERVKVVVRDSPSGDKAMLFTRGPILTHLPNYAQFVWRHVGIYGFDFGALCDICSHHPRSLLAQAENLEQLTWMERYSIGVSVVPGLAAPVDTEADYLAFVARTRELAQKAEPGQITRLSVPIMKRLAPRLSVPPE